MIRNAVKCKKVGTEKCFPEDSPPKEKPLISESLKKKLSKYRIQQSHRSNVNRSLFTVTSEEDNKSCLPHIDSGGFDSRNQHGPPPQTSQPNQFDSLMSSEGSVMSGTGKPRSQQVSQRGFGGSNQLKILSSEWDSTTGGNRTSRRKERSMQSLNEIKDHRTRV